MMLSCTTKMLITRQNRINPVRKKENHDGNDTPDDTLDESQGKQINIRLTDEEYEKLLSFARERGTEKNATATEVAREIIIHAINFWEKKLRRGDVTQSRYVIRKQMEIIDPSKITDEFIDSLSSDILDEMEIQVDENLNFREVERRLLLWNRENHMSVKKKEFDGKIVYCIKHDLGKNWSSIHSKVYTGMLKKLNVIFPLDTADVQEYFDENMLKIVVQKTENLMNYERGVKEVNP